MGEGGKGASSPLFRLNCVMRLVRGTPAEHLLPLLNAEPQAARGPAPCIAAHVLIGGIRGTRLGLPVCVRDRAWTAPVPHPPQQALPCTTFPWPLTPRSPLRPARTTPLSPTPPGLGEEEHHVVAPGAGSFPEHRHRRQPVCGGCQRNLRRVQDGCSWHPSRGPCGPAHLRSVPARAVRWAARLPLLPLPWGVRVQWLRLSQLLKRSLLTSIPPPPPRTVRLIAAANDMPLVAYSATAAELMDLGSMPVGTVARTCANDLTTAMAVFRLLRFFDWQRYNIIYVHDSFGRSLFETLSEITELGVCAPGLARPPAVLLAAVVGPCVAEGPPLADCPVSLTRLRGRGGSALLLPPRSVAGHPRYSSPGLLWWRLAGCRGRGRAGVG